MMSDRKTKALKKKRTYTAEEIDAYLNDVNRHAFEEAVRVAKMEARLAYFERRLTEAFEVTVDVAPDEAATYAKRAGEFLMERRNLSAYKSKLLGLDAATRAGISSLVNPDDDAIVLDKIKKRIEAKKQEAIEEALKTAEISDAEVTDASTGSDSTD